MIIMIMIMIMIMIIIMMVIMIMMIMIMMFSCMRWSLYITWIDSKLWFLCCGNNLCMDKIYTIVDFTVCNTNGVRSGSGEKDR